MRKSIEDDFRTLVDMRKSGKRQMDEFFSKGLCDHTSSSWIVITKMSDEKDLKSYCLLSRQLIQVEIPSRRWICVWSVFIG